MKKEIEPPASAIENDPDDDLLPEYDFRDGKPNHHAGWLHEGAEVFINDVRHVVRGKTIVPEPLPADASKPASPETDGLTQ